MMRFGKACEWMPKKRAVPSRCLSLTLMPMLMTIEQAGFEMSNPVA